MGLRQESGRDDRYPREMKVLRWPDLGAHGERSPPPVAKHDGIETEQMAIVSGREAHRTTALRRRIRGDGTAVGREHSPDLRTRASVMRQAAVIRPGPPVKMPCPVAYAATAC